MRDEVPGAKLGIIAMMGRLCAAKVGIEPLFWRSFRAINYRRTRSWRNPFEL